MKFDEKFEIKILEGSKTITVRKRGRSEVFPIRGENVEATVLHGIIAFVFLGLVVNGVFCHTSNGFDSKEEMFEYYDAYFTTKFETAYIHKLRILKG